MQDQFIDVGNTKRRYELALENFKSDSKVSDKNKETILRFLRDAALGKTVHNRAKKKIRPGRLLKYIHQLYPIMLYLNKDLEQVTMTDMEKFIEALENDVIKSRAMRVIGDNLVKADLPYHPRTKVDIKVGVRKFYSWLLGNTRSLPPLVEWIDTYIEESQVSALSPTEVSQMIDRATTSSRRALIQILFDGGFRLGELLNVRLHHLDLRDIGGFDIPQKCFFARVPYSKTMPRIVSMPMHETTRWLSLWLEDHPAKPVIKDDGSIQAEDLSAQLFPMASESVRQAIREIGQKALGKRVYPHLLRHTSATYWSNKLPYFKFCKRFGWTMTSKMPQKYIDRSGVDEMEVASIYLADERSKLAREKQDLLSEVAALRSQNH